MSELLDLTEKSPKDNIEICVYFVVFVHCVVVFSLRAPPER